MKHISTILLLLTAAISYGQYTLDDTIKNHLFLRQVYPEFNGNKCSLSNKYYEPQDLHFQTCSDPMHQIAMMNGASMECYLLQKQLKDTLRQHFTDSELFDIVQFSKIPFYRIAAFELYAQTDYPSDQVSDFLRRGNIPSFYMYDDRLKNSVPEKYMPIPNSLQPSEGIIRLKMLDIVNPNAMIWLMKDTLDRCEMVEVPKYFSSSPLDMETYISVLAFINNYCIESFVTSRVIAISPSFTISQPIYSFGEINLNHINESLNQFELEGYIKVSNTSEKTIYISAQGSSHTSCLNSTYTIEPKKEILIEFKSTVDLENVAPSIERSITLQNINTGETLGFKFNAEFINK